MNHNLIIDTRMQASQSYVLICFHACCNTQRSLHIMMAASNCHTHKWAKFLICSKVNDTGETSPWLHESVKYKTLSLTDIFHKCTCSEFLIFFYSALGFLCISQIIVVTILLDAGSQPLSGDMVHLVISHKWWRKFRGNL